MARQKENDNVTIWNFRRDISIGTILHVLAILVVVIATWSNLQKELALIHYDLNQLITSNVKLQEHIEQLADQYHNHEYRIGILETKILPPQPTQNSFGQHKNLVPSG